jgi:hypothetical protein
MPAARTMGSQERHHQTFGKRSNLEFLVLTRSLMERITQQGEIISQTTNLSKGKDVKGQRLALEIIPKEILMNLADLVNPVKDLLRAATTINRPVVLELTLPITRGRQATIQDLALRLLEPAHNLPSSLLSASADPLHLDLIMIPRLDLSSMTADAAQIDEVTAMIPLSLRLDLL